MTETNSKILILLSSFVLIGLALPIKLSLVTLYIFILFSLFLIYKNRKISFKYIFPLLTALFFTAHFWHYFFDLNSIHSAQESLRKISFLFVPFIFLNLPKIESKSFLKSVFKIYNYGLILIGFILICTAGIKFYHSGNYNVFFYHQLVSIINGSAIYFSLIYTFSLIISLEHYLENNHKISYVPIAFNTLMVILLSSKVFALVLVIIYIYYFLKSKKDRLKLAVFFAAMILLPFIFKGETIVKRYSETSFNDILSVKKNIDPSTTFDGFSLRKEFIKIGLELSLRDTETLIFGIGPGDTQNVLNKIITQKGFYVGEVDKPGLGFLNYNFHNQYIQTLVETGLIGFVILILMFIYLLKKGLEHQNSYLIILNIVFLISFFTESILSRQMGIFSFLVFNSLLIFSTNIHNEH